jgi:iron complex outermembrane recepter protein
VSRPNPPFRLSLSVASLTLAIAGGTPTWAQKARGGLAETTVALDPISVEGSFTSTPAYRVEELYSGTKTVTPRWFRPIPRVLSGPRSGFRPRWRA